MSMKESKEMTLRNKLGLHARAAARFVRTVTPYASSIEVSFNGASVDGRSILGLMMLAATQGSTLTITAEGTDADQALEALFDLIHHRCFDEEE